MWDQIGADLGGHLNLPRSEKSGNEFARGPKKTARIRQNASKQAAF